MNLKVIALLLMVSYACWAITSPPEEEAEALREWREKIESCDQWSSAEKFEMLIEAIYKLNQPSIYANQAAALPVWEKAVRSLRQSEGYTDYFRGKIIAMREEGRGDPAEFTRYLNQRGLWFISLSQVKTPEVVEFFANFLDDDDRHFIGDHGATLGQEAAMKIRDMIEDPPAKTALRMELWLEWRDRVRAGKQTYSFKGSKKRYDFQGEVLAAPRTSRRPVDERSERPAVDQANEPEETPWVPVAGALLALLLGFAFWKWKARPVS